MFGQWRLILVLLLLASSRNEAIWKAPSISLGRGNATARQIRFEQDCRVVTCNHKNWKQGTNSSCGPAATSHVAYQFNRPYMNPLWSWPDSIEHPPILLEHYFKTFLSVSCNRSCGLGGLGTLIYHRSIYVHAWFYYLNPRVWPKWYTSVFSLCSIFSALVMPLFYIPLNLVFNCCNLIILKRMMKADSGAALYFHKFEVVSDMVLNLITNIERTQLIHAIELWFWNCRIFHYVRLYDAVMALRQLAEAINQCFVLALVSDRLMAVVRPFKYRKANHKARSRKWAQRIILCSIFVFWGPLSWITYCSYLINGFDRSVKVWIRNAESYWNVFVMGGLLLAQIVVSRVYLKKFQQFAKQKPTSGARKKAFEQEHRLKRLLAGTVSLNILSSAFRRMQVLNQVYLAMYALYWGKTRSALAQAAARKESPHHMYYDMVPNMVYWVSYALINPFLSFINSSGAMFFHIVFSKAYRKAFHG